MNCDSIKYLSQISHDIAQNECLVTMPASKEPDAMSFRRQGASTTNHSSSTIRLCSSDLP